VAYQEKMRKLIFVIIGIIVIFFYITKADAMYRQDRLLEGLIVKAGIIWNDLEEMQKQVHSLAEDARKILCADGVMNHCEEDVKEIKKRSALIKSKPITTGSIYTIDVTHYSAEISQTDNSPCIGASNQNLCDLHERGMRIIALSPDLVGRHAKPFRYGDKIWLTHSNINCSGEFVIMDTMNARYYYRGDIFSPEEDFGKCNGAKMQMIK